MVIADQGARLPWWHRRVVLVTDDEPWASRAGETIRQSGGRLEIIAWSEAASLTSPVGALVVDVDVTTRDVEGVDTVLAGWAAEGRQPTTLLWIPRARGAARIDHMVNRLRYPHVFERTSTEEVAAHLKRPLSRILARGGWIVPWFAAALGWSAEPFLVHVLGLPVLAERPPKNVKEWVRAVGKLSHTELVALFREHGAPNPKEVHNRLVFSRATVWAAEQRLAPTRRRLANHLRYSATEKVYGAGLAGGAGRCARVPVGRPPGSLSSPSGRAPAP